MRSFNGNIGRNRSSFRSFYNRGIIANSDLDASP
jgi:hypothetical protein